MLSHPKQNGCARELPDLCQSLLEQELKPSLFEAIQTLRLFVTLSIAWPILTKAEGLKNSQGLRAYK